MNKRFSSIDRGDFDSQLSKLVKVNVPIENKSKSHHRKSFDLVEQVFEG